MPTYAGPIWSNGREVGSGFVRVERGRVVEEGSGEPRAAIPSVILDGLHNYHTHVGDAFLQGRPLPRSLKALVKPGTGYKHRMLASTPRARIVRGMEKALREYASNGIRSVLDFREQGLPGLAMLQEAMANAGPQPIVRALGRPLKRPADMDEVASVAEAGDGLGISSVTDLDLETLETVAKVCRRLQKPMVFHHSEDRREPAADVLRYEPALLVHLCRSTAADLRAVERAGVPVAVCPSSNAYFRRVPPIRQLYKLGIPFFLGTDNAMLGGMDLLAEVARARRSAKTVPDTAFLQSLTTPIEKGIKGLAPVQQRPSAPERVVILPRRKSRVVWRAPSVVASR